MTNSGERIAVTNPDGVIVYSEYGNDGHDFRDVIQDPQQRSEADAQFRRVLNGQHAKSLCQINTASGLTWIATEVALINGMLISRHYELVEPLRASPRELQVCVLLGHGLRRETIARRLGISPHTVSRHVEEIREKYKVDTERDLAVACARRLRAVQILLEVQGVEFPGPEECSNCTMACTLNRCNIHRQWG